MVKYLIELHKEKPIAIGEIKAILDKNTKYFIEFEKDNFIFVDCESELPNLIKTLSFTHAIYEYICEYDDESLKKVNWKDYYKNNFAIKSIDKTVIEKISEPLWDGIIDPKVKLNNSDTEIYMFFNKVFILRQKIINELKGRITRDVPMRSCVFLSTLLAKAIVNLTSGKTLYDPFCGVGSILIEAGLQDRQVLGSDLSYQLIKGCELNLKHYNIINYDLFRADATKHALNDKVDAVVCDLPYGQSAKLFGEENRALYLNFLKNSSNILKKGGDLVLIFPSYIDHKKVVKESGLKIKDEYEEYVHRHLTRVIVHIIL